ncbi:MAG: TonB family protein [Bacteroidales bacterium]
MERKNFFRRDPQSKRVIFFQIGLLAAFSIVLTAFELKQSEKPFILLTGTTAGTMLSDTIINTRQEQPKTPQPMRPTPTVIDIVDNTTDITGDIDINVDIIPGKELPRYEPPKGREEKEVPDPPIEPFPDVYASFKGGEEALYAFLGKNLVYPFPAKSARLEGTVHVRFVVEEDGSITNIEVAQGGIGGGCEEAAVDVVKKMPSWNPGKQRNRPVRSWFILPIKFELIN